MVREILICLYRFFFEKETKKQPNETLSWSSYHLFSDKFYDKWKSGKLTKFEQRGLAIAALQHCRYMLKKRHWTQFKMRLFDIYRISELKKLL